MAVKVFSQLPTCVRNNFFSLFALTALLCTTNFVHSEEDPPEVADPTVLIAVLVRNKAHTLPYFLTLLERLDYPKDRISLWIRSDHNIDDTLTVLRSWLAVIENENEYHSLDTELLESSPENLPDETSLAHWSPQRFTHIIQLREEALTKARKIWADYILFVDADAFLTDPFVLRRLMAKGLTIAAPMLLSDGLYSNFWCGMTEDYYYQRTDEYRPTLRRERKGCFAVPMVHSAVLIDLRRAASRHLTFEGSRVPGYRGPHDDIITFALAANKSGIPLHICNDEQYGFIMVPLEQGDSLDIDYNQLTNLKLEVLVENPPLPVSEALAEFISYPKKDTLEFDHIYMINLLRRPERRHRMLLCFAELGLDVTVIDAVDGRELNASLLDKRDIRMMPDYQDPYHKRPLTMGEVGCFLSHYNVWKEVVARGDRRAMVLEDDIRFEPFFRSKVARLVGELETLKLDWDLVYLGRKRLQESEEPWVEGAGMLVRAGYSYWTLGYLLSQRGARKLLDARPLDNLLPVDEYLPILFDKHPQATWKGHFPTRDLMALSAAPLLVYPTHYTGEQGYISDTENSIVIEDDDDDQDVPTPASPSFTAPPDFASHDDL